MDIVLEDSVFQRQVLEGFDSDEEWLGFLDGECAFVAVETDDFILCVDLSSVGSQGQVLVDARLLSTVPVVSGGADLGLETGSSTQLRVIAFAGLLMQSFRGSCIKHICGSKCWDAKF